MNEDYDSLNTKHERNILSTRQCPDSQFEEPDSEMAQAANSNRDSEEHNTIMTVQQPQVSESEEPNWADIVQLCQFQIYLKKCRRIFISLSFVFFCQTVMALTEYCLLWKNFHYNNLYVLLCILENLLHLHFFMIELNQVVQKRLDSVNNDEYEYLEQFKDYQTPLSLQNVLIYLLQRRIQLFKANQTAFSVMFVFGFTKLCNPFDDVQTWFLSAQLSMGFLVFALLMGAMVIVCLMMPFVFCWYHCMQRDFRVQVSAPDFSAPVELPDPVSYRSLNHELTQPCYICLQEYEQEEMIVQMKCDAKHVFHRECIEPWVETHPFCPVCRQNIY